MPATAEEVRSAIVFTEFEITGNRITAAELGLLLRTLNNLMGRLYPPMYGPAAYGEEFPGVYVVGISQASPLRVVFQMVNIPKDAVLAFVDLCKTAMFYREEKEKRAAQAAGEWENVLEKRLNNIERSIVVAQNLQSASQAHPMTIAEVSTLLRSVEQSPAKLLNIGIKKGETT